MSNKVLNSVDAFFALHLTFIPSCQFPLPSLILVYSLDSISLLSDEAAQPPGS